MTNQEQANLETLYGEPGVIRNGYEVRNINGDLLGDLSDVDLEFVQEHRCTSDCRRVGCMSAFQPKGY